MSVFIHNFGFIRPGTQGNQTTVNDIAKDLYDLSWMGCSEQIEIISRDYLKELEFETKSLMSLQTQLAVIAIQECLTEVSKDYLKERSGIIFVSNGHITLEDMTIKILKRFSLDPNGDYDFALLKENLDRIPPLDGIKMLSTAVTHFASKFYQIHGPGQQIFSGDNGALQSLIEAYYAINNKQYDFAVVVGSHAPFQKNSLPFYELQNEMKGSKQPLSEGACAFFLTNNVDIKYCGRITEVECGFDYQKDIQTPNEFLDFGPVTSLMEITDNLNKKSKDPRRVSFFSSDITGFYSKLGLEVYSL